METVTTIAIEPNHIDELGHVNNTFYVAYLEQARGDWYERAGISFSQMNERGIGTVLVRLDIQFKKELLLEDRPVVHTIPHRLGNKSFVFRQVMYNQRKEVVAEAAVTNVMFDVKQRKSIPVAEEIRKFFPKTEE